MRVSKTRLRVACSRVRCRTKNYLWKTRPNSSGVRRQLNLPDCRRTLESVSGSPFGSRFADSRLRGFVRASRGRRFLSVHAAHGAPSFAPTLPPFSSPPPSPSPPSYLLKTPLFLFLFQFCCLVCVTGRAVSPSSEQVAPRGTHARAY